MDANNHNRIAELFAATHTMSVSERTVYLERSGVDDVVRRDVEALIDCHHRDGAFLDTPALGPGFRPPDPVEEGADDRLIGHRIGCYRITRIIASGGMGVVYEAEQDRPDRLVALKVMRQALASPSTRRRFEYESELLGRLNHPCIARVYDAGLHHFGDEQSGDTPAVDVPYFAMELVPEARPITTYAAEQQLDLKARLELFATVCDAIHHGHQRGVIHRDVKPANILVGADDKPKIIDFGISRAIDADSTISMHTGVGQILGTIPYMSHEQLAGDPTQIDGRVDVYALGVVMYELLSGRLPYDLKGRSVAEAIILMREREPASLATTNRVFRGDLETIVGKALERDPARRYPSASELAADVRRYLNNEPVTARRPSALYQVQKLARRHRAAFAATVAALVILVAGSITSSGLAIEATQQRDSAETAARALARLITEGERQGDNIIVPMREIAALVDGGGLTDPESRADLHRVIAKHWQARTHHQLALKHFERQLELRRGHPGVDDVALLWALCDLAQFELARGQLDAVTAYTDEMLAIRQRRFGEAHWVLLPDDRLRAVILANTLDPHEHERLRSEFAIMRGDANALAAPAPHPASTLALAPILTEEFAGRELDSSWSLHSNNISSWAGGMGSSRFTVDDIVPNGDPRSQRGAKAFITCARTIPRLQDFRLQFTAGWDLAASERVVRTLLVRVVDGYGNTVAEVSATDPWSMHEGEFRATVTNTDVVHTGFDSMPAQGDATFQITRAGHRIIFSRDGVPFAAGICDVPVVEVQLEFHFAAIDRPGRRSSFAPVWIERIEIDGIETDRAAYVQE